MIDTAIWVLVILLGIMAIGVAESVRSGRLAGVNWAAVKTAAMGTAVLLITLTSAVLAISWVIVVLLVEIWQPFLIFIGAIAGSVVMLTLFARHRSMFYASAMAAIAAVLFLFL